jgi:hypothetical protein
MDIDHEKKVHINPNPNQIHTSYSSPSLTNTLSNNHQAGSFRISVAPAPTIANLIANKQLQPRLSNISSNITSQSVARKCHVCSKITQTNQPNMKYTNTDSFMVHCSTCDRYSHPNCLELNPTLVNWQCVMQYDWQCMECKKCSKCNNPHDEDKMMFCDRCDRGFHTYCVGLGEVPVGSWICKQCKFVSTDKPNENHHVINKIDVNGSHIVKSEFNTPIRSMIQQIKSASSSRPSNGTGKRGRPPGSLNKPKDPNSPKKLT